MPEHEAHDTDSRDTMIQRMCKESIEVWRNNPIEAIALTQLGVMVQAYFNKYFYQQEDVEKHTYVYPTPVTDWVLTQALLWYGELGTLCNSTFWNRQTIDKVCQEATTVLKSSKGFLEGSVKFIVFLNPQEPKFTLKLYYLEKK